MSIALLMGVSAWAQDPAAVSVYEDCSKNGKTYDVRPTTGTENGHTWVDLGLPSGLKWASYNDAKECHTDYRTGYSAERYFCGSRQQGAVGVGKAECQKRVF